MDQSASVLGIQGSALYISFHPTLSAHPVAFPQTTPELVFIIADTLVTADKHTTGPTNYNLRVVECTLAAQILAKKLNLGPLPQDAGPLGSSLKGLMDLYFANQADLPLEHKLQRLLDLAGQTLDQDHGYTREEIAHVLEIPVCELVQRCMTKFPVLAGRFALRARALHVLAEALRVVRFRALLAAPQLATVAAALGAIMDASHVSCRELYGCSCPELDQLCEIAKREGAYGSRLTGAGWGGCSVHLVPRDRVEAVKEAWRREYYRVRFPGMGEEAMEAAVVTSQPGSGAVVFRVRR